MYEAHFQLRQTPFSISPDPEFLYFSEGHREALAHLGYGLTQGGFLLISGEVGTGKTTLLRNLMRQVPADIDVAFILNPRLTVRELLETICDELGIPHPVTEGSSIKGYIDALTGHLLATHASGRSTLLVIDEAQNLTPAVLEQIRLLTNLETDKRKLLRIVLLGQPELLDLLARKELRQLAQRITARYHLQGLDRADTRAYVLHRLEHAGGSPLIFTRPALDRIYRLSGGIPRLINLIADRALLGAYAAGVARVTWRMVGRAAREVLDQRRSRQRIRRLLIGTTATIAAAVVATLGMTTVLNRTPIPPTAAMATRGTPEETAAPAAGPQEAPPDLASNAADEARPADSSPPSEPDEVIELVRPLQPVEREAPQQAGATDLQPVLPPDQALPLEQAELPTVHASSLTRPEVTTFQSRHLAFEAVFGRWGIPFDGNDRNAIPCEFAPSAGLQCLQGTGTWDDLERFNLPVVLQLWGEGTDPYYAALISKSAESITLDVAGTVQQLRIAQLADHWFGGYVLLWRPPPGYAGSVEIGQQSSSVPWTREQLLALGLIEQSASKESERYDETLRAAVIGFQRGEGLLPDGILGPQTWIQLSQRRGFTQPQLHD